MLNAEGIRQMLAQGTNAKTLGGMMTTGKVVNVHLVRDMHRLFGNFAAQIRIQPGCSGLRDIALGAAAA